MTSSSSSIEYKLILVQEPTIGAAFEDNLLGRIGLAPPLVLELQVIKDGQASDASAELPFLICQCSLLDEQGSTADMVNQTAVSAAAAADAAQSPSKLTVPTGSTRARRGRRSSSGRRGSASTSAVSTRSSESTDASTSTGAISDDIPSSHTATRSGQESPAKLARMLYGTLVGGPQLYLAPPTTTASASRGEQGEKPYFFFPEISIRTPGKFRIVCRLMRLSLPGMQERDVMDDGVLASVETQVFEVVKRGDYTAPYVTDVSRHFARQGVPLLLPPGVSAD
ncbi:uncharacterized protein UBRO_06309 [Ustilago bromivora]|uniref:Velvet domain-containing protein n=1 Tax=Ustilago bromivora TaxID=307758 RepID=A0A1K0HH37_9BASI|nr:uncharacterized protein UBRO_06309 [Ustilago bromivora]SYW80356.1 uncharacterized protein UBRO2_03624 [Ustilago bromivora]